MRMCMRVVGEGVDMKPHDVLVGLISFISDFECLAQETTHACYKARGGRGGEGVCGCSMRSGCGVGR